MLESSARTTEPFTGDEYLESIRDGREVYVYGERVGDVTTHPAFRNTARSIARLYDALHDPQRRDLITTPTDTGSDGVTHKFFRFPRTVEDCVGDLEAIAEWARIGYGWLGRSPTTRRRSWPRSARTRTSTTHLRLTKDLRIAPRTNASLGAARAEYGAYRGHKLGPCLS